MPAICWRKVAISKGRRKSNEKKKVLHSISKGEGKKKRGCHIEESGRAFNMQEVEWSGVGWRREAGDHSHTLTDTSHILLAKKKNGRWMEKKMGGGGPRAKRSAFDNNSSSSSSSFLLLKKTDDEKKKRCSEHRGLWAFLYTFFFFFMRHVFLAPKTLTKVKCE